MKKLYLLAFIFSFHVAIAAYVNSTFLSGLIGEHFIGIIYTVSSILTLVAFGSSPKILKRFGNYKVTVVVLIINFGSLLFLGLSSSKLLLIGAFMLFILTNNMMILLLDVFFERLEDAKSVGSMRGTYLSTANLAWLLSPMISGFIIMGRGYQSIYLVSAIMAFFIFILLLVKKMPDSHEYHKADFIKTLVKISKNKRIWTISAINFLLQFFYVFMVVYATVYLVNHIGFDWKSLGVVFTIMLLPFVIFGLPVGALIDRGIKEKTLLFAGFIIIGFSTIMLAFINTPSIILWGTMLFLTRTGAAIIETTSETYFFKRTTALDADLLSFFRDMYPLAYIIAPIMATVILFIFPFKAIFIILGIIMLSGIFLVRKLAD